MERKTDDYAPKNEVITEQRLDALKRMLSDLANLSVEEIQSLAEKMSKIDLDNLTILTDRLKGLNVEAARHESEVQEEKKITKVPLLVFSGLGSAKVSGYANCVDSGKGRWMFKSLELKGSLNKGAVLVLAARFGIKERLTKELYTKGIWDDHFLLKLSCRFEENAPSVVKAFEKGDPAGVEFSDELFGDWIYSGTADVSIDKETIPATVEIITK